MVYSRESRIKDVLKSPVGHDVIAKLLMQAGKSMALVENPIVGNIKLKSLPKLSRGLVDDSFVDLLASLFNSVPDTPQPYDGPIQRAWWKEAVVYQIYPRSFQDSNGDGIGDLNGITQRLDYLKELGVDVLWLSPIYDSPNDDNGYDIRDYKAIMKEFGTMEDFNRLLDGVHARGMKLIMDLVINHTSDEHAWFKEALQNPDSPCRDYYLFRPAKDGKTPPNNWTSFFSGSAWNHYPEQSFWALHLFSKKQMDLNWDNPALRSSVYEMINWWLQKGIDGFRLDVINYISKAEGLPDGNETVGKLMGFTGVEHYFYGPNLHRCLQEMHENTFSRYDVMTVGETPGVGIEMAKLLTDERRKELDMVFSFDHLENPGKARFDLYRYDLRCLKEILCDWQQHYGNASWNSLFFENHDNPRMVSKINPDPAFREVIAKLLAVIQFTLKGTPFVFQGQELGMVNASFSSIDELRDIESINLYHELLQKGKSEAEALTIINGGSRDHARTPMQWSGEPNAGFTAGEPWIRPNASYPAINAESEQQDAQSVFAFYKQVIALRHQNPALVYGEFALEPTPRELFCYRRVLDGAEFYIEINLTEQPQKRKAKASAYTPVLSNYTKPLEMLRPYEATIYRI
ncbi:alpha-glucosidase [Acetanaerobacterium elongatum]|uniref:Oligo-1,6-glucosidase n=1 Tax=Acetanaerobacterium elongatum TaxID=258515 RepID=A0A1H0BYH1_9FIRM|nr:alpha-glucosidase [Acetanaerobacterium elongatum]SDN50741.1 oligo-1,6-glucosidase [Acetanaerobacterium elongatum]